MYKRIVVSRHGGPEVLQLVEEELPQPGPGETRVRILASGVAWGDVLKRAGYIAAPTPFTPGYDLVGVVDELGENVSTVQVGQVVAALPLSGGYAEFVCLPATELVPVPASLDPAEAVCVVLNYVVAYQLLHRAAQARPGERILIHGAGGGVGTALLQLGKLAQLEMYGTASSAKQDLVAGLGAMPIDYRQEDFVARTRALTGDGVDAVFDPIGGTHVWRSYKTLRRGGRLIAFGAHSLITDGKLKVAAGFMLMASLNLIPDRRAVLLFNVTRPKYSSPAGCREDLPKLLDLLAQRKIEPVIAARLPLAEASRAHRLLEKATVGGKIVLLCGE